ncbi:MAG: hypothetical protein PWQ29_1053 [Verrucomicrobiota bacterium]|jgi:hypothetical protein|nr:hypothetical protein [Verrucomicrobiota bacterium]MDK2963659.1 hypothetical protein [Verrucomicrobiota bacterium]
MKTTLNIDETLLKKAAGLTGGNLQTRKEIPALLHDLPSVTTAEEMNLMRGLN